LLVPVDEVRAFALDALRRCGAPSAAAALQADVLVEAELRGLPSHGLQRLPRLVRRIERRLADPAATGLHTWLRPGFLAVEGERGLGPVVGAAAIKAALPAARDQGLAVAAVRGANHLGMLAWYAERIAAAGLIGIVLSSSEALVHPFGGRRAMLGTNPIAVAIPIPGSEPFLLDLATSKVSMGKVHAYAARGRTLAPGWALDEEGEATTDPARAKRGALAPFGEAKGYGLSLAFELLVAGLAGSDLAPDVRGTLDAEHLCNKGDLFVLIDPPPHPGSSAVASYLDALRATPASMAGTPVAVPGDGARARRRSAIDKGVDIDAGVWSDLTHLARNAA
jgi:L-2-hydroxycarboxylate dehydrogenase (NAD+)